MLMYIEEKIYSSFFAGIRSLIFMLAGVSFQIKGFSRLFFYTFPAHGSETLLSDISSHRESWKSLYNFSSFILISKGGLRVYIYENTSKRCLLELKMRKSFCDLWSDSERRWRIYYSFFFLVTFLSENLFWIILRFKFIYYRVY